MRPRVLLGQVTSPRTNHQGKRWRLQLGEPSDGDGVPYVGQTSYWAQCRGKGGIALCPLPNGDSKQITSGLKIYGPGRTHAIVP